MSAIGPKRTWQQSLSHSTLEADAGYSTEVALAASFFRIARHIDVALRTAMTGKTGDVVIFRHGHAECRPAIALGDSREVLASGPARQRELFRYDFLFPGISPRLAVPD